MKMFGRRHGDPGMLPSVQGADMDDSSMRDGELFVFYTFHATFLFYNRLIMSFTTSSVLAFPPMSGVSSLPSAKLASTAL